MFKQISALAFFLSCLLLTVQASAEPKAGSIVEPRAGHIDWGSWSLDWAVEAHDGLALKNVHYRGLKVLHKGSLPVIRVKYVRDWIWQPPFYCGPFEDRISWRRLVAMPSCGYRRVCLKEYTFDGIRMLELGIYARIGEYHLYQGWYITETGEIRARMWSRGLSCPMDHDHHPYWRLDFDILGANQDQITFIDDPEVYVTEKNETDSGWWIIKDLPTEKGVTVLRRGEDGKPDGFSTKNAAGRLYHYSEDEQWRFGARGHLGYENREYINNADVVFWYVAHLHHRAAQGGDAWHWVGPLIMTSGYTP